MATTSKQVRLLREGGVGIGLTLVGTFAAQLHIPLPYWLSVAGVVLGFAFILHALLPERIGRIVMTPALTLMLVCAIGLVMGGFWHLVADRLHRVATPRAPAQQQRAAVSTEAQAVPPPPPEPIPRVPSTASRRLSPAQQERLADEFAVLKPLLQKYNVGCIVFSDTQDSGSVELAADLRAAISRAGIETGNVDDYHQTPSDLKETGLGVDVIDPAIPGETGTKVKEALVRAGFESRFGTLPTGSWIAGSVGIFVAPAPFQHHRSAPLS